MSEPFDPDVFVDAVAPLLDLSLGPESRRSVVVHLRIAADLAAKLAVVPLDDHAEPAPVFTP